MKDSYQILLPNRQVYYNKYHVLIFQKHPLQHTDFCILQGYCRLNFGKRRRRNTTIYIVQQRCEGVVFHTSHKKMGVIERIVLGILQLDTSFNNNFHLQICLENSEKKKARIKRRDSPFLLVASPLETEYLETKMTKVQFNFYKLYYIPDMVFAYRSMVRITNFTRSLRI